MHLTHCMSCNKAFATVHILDLQDGAIVGKKHLCATCAETAGMVQQKTLPQAEMLELIENIDKVGEHESTGRRAEGLACPACNLTAAEFKARARMGCPRCYEVFKRGLLPLLERVHDATSHRGRVPTGTTPIAAAAPDPRADAREHLAQLQERLTAAIEEENYEEAARLRDEINSASDGVALSSELTFPDDYNVGEWLQGNGPDADIAVCTRVRFARNVMGFRFSTCMPEHEAHELTDHLRRQLGRSGFAEELRILDLDNLEELRRGVLLERHLISRELANAERSRFVAVNETESVSVMVNEEDHIRAQVFQTGHSIGEAYERAESLDEALMERVEIAFSEEFGFLTACPTNTGTGLRVSVMLHLPGLVWAEEIEKATTAAQKTSMAVRGLYGEGSRASGDFYQVSNQITLGRSERQITADVGDAVRALVDWERKVRDALLKGDSRQRTLDRIYRSLGTLERARILTTDEALTCLSALRFGIQQGLVEEITPQQANIALLLSQPAHLQRLCNAVLSPAERDERRAELMRDLMRRREKS